MYCCINQYSSCRQMSCCFYLILYFLSLPPIIFQAYHKFFMHVLLLLTFIISQLYISPGYISINLQVIYPLCFQHSSIATHNIFYIFPSLFIHCVTNMVLLLLRIYVYISSCYLTTVLPTYSILPSICIIFICRFIFVFIINGFVDCVIICLIEPVLEAQSMHL